MIKAIRIFIAAAVLMSVSDSAHAVEKQIGAYLPENNLKIPEFSAMADGLSKGQYDSVLDLIESVYTPIVAKRGGRFSISRLWTNDSVNAAARRNGNDWIILMYGGLARHPLVTQDGFAVVACHELGHHLGGFPLRRAGPLSNEGQGDYFANAKCLRLIFGDSASQSFTRDPLDPIAVRACSSAHPNMPQDQVICARAATAALAQGRFLQQLGGEDTPPQFDTPDRSAVANTDDGHPKSQCRVDTALQASLCSKPATEDFSDDSPDPGACTLSQGHRVGMRPLCWYKPPPSEAPLAFERLRPAFDRASILSSLREPAF